MGHSASPFTPSLTPEDRSRLEALFSNLKDMVPRNIGYPCNQVFDYSELFRFLEFSANNVGDPFTGSNYRMNTHDFEREVVEEFARLTRAPKDGWWGYVTGGGTEGNMYGLYVARELFPEGMCYFSEDTHYSVAKILRLQHTRNIMIKSQDDGQMDYEDLRESLRIHRDVPPIIFANIGTTMKGAVDDVGKIRGILAELAIQNSYIHADAALSGVILPFVENAPAWDFSAGVDSISISGHKMLGAPVPCGVVLAHKKDVERIARSIEYVGTLDTTIAGSRSAFSPLLLWYRLHSLGPEGLAQLVKGCLARAEYAVRLLNQHHIPAWRHHHSVTVVFPRPPESLMKKWIIAPKNEIGHFLTMPHVSESLIDEFVADYVLALQETTQPQPI